MSARDDELSAIDPALLDAITGGTATNEQITEALQGIQKSLDGLKSTSNNNTNWLQQLLPFLLFSRGGLLSGGGGLLGGGGICGCGCGLPRGRCGH